MPSDKGESNYNDVRKEMIKWLVVTVFAVAVLFAGLYLIVNPLVQRLVTKVQDQSDRLAMQERDLGDLQKKLVAMEATRAEIEQQLDVWKKKIGPLINDAQLTSDVRKTMESLSSLPPSDRNFVTWVGAADVRLKTLEASDNPIDLDVLYVNLNRASHSLGKVIGAQKLTGKDQIYQTYADQVTNATSAYLDRLPAARKKAAENRDKKP